MGSEKGYKMKQRVPLPLPIKPPRNKTFPKSLKNAYIFILGQADSGKSTTLNYLCGGREISPVERETGTEEVLQFSADLSSGGLRIIDTPGLGDMNGVEWDSQIIATIDSFRKMHEELGSCIPNIVLIFGRFDDNRIEGDTASFVKMLKSVDLRREKLLDSRHNNLIIVLTHAMNGKKVLRENPTPRIELVKSLVRTFTRFHEPPIILLAENEADDFNLPKSETNSGSHVLPNGEAYPQNIVESIFEICRASGDSDGLKIFQEALATDQSRHALQLSTTTSVKLIAEAQSTELAVQLTNAYFNKSTEMLDKLAIEWNARGRSCTEPVYQDFLAELESKGYQDFHRVPQDPEHVIKLMISFKRDPDLLSLMEKIMQLNIPTINDINPKRRIGFGYYTTTDSFLEHSPVEFLNFKTSQDLIFKLPEDIRYTPVKRSGEPDEYTFFNFVRDRKEYCCVRTDHLKLKHQILTEGLMMKPGYNYYPVPSPPARKKKPDRASISNRSSKLPPIPTKNQHFITLVKEFRLGKLTYDPAGRSNHNLNYDFVTTVKQLQPFTRSRAGRKQWRTFFNDHGTHVVKSAFVGGIMEIRIDKQMFLHMLATSDYKLEDPKDVQKIHAEIYGFFFDPQRRVMQTLRNIQIPENLIFKVNFVGGRVNTTDVENLLNVGLMERANIINEWKTSIYESPIVLERELELIDMKEFVEQCTKGGYSKKLEKIVKSYDDAFETLLISLPLQSKQRNCALL